MSSHEKSNKDIAIIGVACRFPSAQDYKEFWSNLEKGIDSIKEMPNNRWDANKYYSSNIEEPNKSISKWCGIVDNIDKFDNQFFNVSPREAIEMDPQQRLLLQETYSCIEDSGVSLKELQSKKTSIYVGAMTDDYLHEEIAKKQNIDGYFCTGSFENILANRISYVFNLKGTSISVNAACASSLIAMNEAKLSLCEYESDYAFVSAVNLNIHPLKYISFSKARMLSPDGKCKTFDKDANGYVPGDGVAVILLQRLEEAIESKANIYGILKGIAINHSGHTISMTSPRVEAQKDVILSAYKDAKISPETVSYAEAHGTGTSLGDPIEVDSITQAFREYTDKVNFCKIGSVKTNIGHLESAAGLAGVIKVLMMMKNKKIPKTLNVNVVNPVINFEDSPFCLANELSEWNPENDLRRASVSSFGFGGANSHVLLEEYKDDNCEEICQNTENENHDLNGFFILSAKNKTSLENLIKDWKNFINTQEYNDFDLRSICDTLTKGREQYEYRVGKFVNNKEDINKFLLSIEQKDFSIRQNKKTRVCFKDVLFEQFDKLLQIGVCPEVVTGVGKGIWQALVISNVIELESVEDRNTCFLNPTIPFWDPISKKTIMPYKFDENYIKTLIEGIEIPDKSYKFLIDEAQILYQNQFTFKKYMNEWEFNDNFEIAMQQKDERHRLFLMVAIESSIKQLNLKWHLTEHRIIKNKKFLELLDLVIDKVLPKKSLKQLLLSENPDYNKICEILNKNQLNINVQGNYEYLKSIRTNLDVGMETSEWLDKVLDIDEAQMDEIMEDSNFINVQVNAQMFENFNRSVISLWLKGIDIDWEKICLEKYNKVSLPTYHFLEKSFWINSNSIKSDEAKPYFNFTGDTLAIISDEFYMKDHVINGDMLLPGVAYLEIGLAFYEYKKNSLGYNEKITAIKDIVWMQPFSLKGLEISKKLEVKLYEVMNADQRAYKYEMLSQDGLHFQGKLVSNAGEPKDEELEVTNTEKIKARCDNRIGKEECYSKLKKLGYSYGESFQAVQEIYIGNKEAVALIKLSQSRQGSFKQFTMHPSLLDASLQSAVLSVIDGDSKLYLPFAIENLEIINPLDDTCYVYSRYKDCKNLKKFDIKIISLSGKMMVKIDGFSLRELKKPVKIEETEKPEIKASNNLKFYEYKWVEKPLVK